MDTADGRISDRADTGFGLEADPKLKSIIKAIVRAVDIVVSDEDKFLAAKGRRGTILAEIATSGIQVYERACRAQ